jgi:lysophospholipase L1-like esterase
MRAPGLVLVLLLGACSGGGGGGATAPAPMAPSVFSATWLASQQDLTEGAPRGASLNPEIVADRTLREVIHVSAGGASLRLRLSNSFGASAITISETHLARSVGGSSIDPASDRRITIDGSGTFTIPARGEVTTDEIALPIAGNVDLAISYYISAPATLTTGHKASTSTTYVASGNVTGTASLPSGAETRPVTYWLSEADISTAPKEVSVIVAFGDSITDGSQSTPGAHKSYPEQLSVRLATEMNPRFGVVNAGIGGNRWLQDNPGPSGASRFERDALGVQGVTHTIILLGINDFEAARLFGAPQVAADQLIATTATAISKAKARGVKVLLGTLLPYKGSSLFNSDDEIQREAYNTWVRQASGADAIVDFDRALQDPADPVALAPQYSSPDRLHPNDAGYGVMAATVNIAAIR